MTLRNLLPKRSRRRLTTTRFRVREKLPLPRVLPDVLVIGAQRGGTSSLYRYLGSHPWVHPSLRKETQYFSSFYGNDESWYRAHFSLQGRAGIERVAGRRPLAFEATPDYLLHPLAAPRAAVLVPDARLIALLRDPVTRAISHHAHMVRLGLETLSFEDALDAEESRTREDLARSLADPSHRPRLFLRFSYRERGHYAEQLGRWLDHFPSDQVLVLESADFYQNTPRIFADILEFLDLPHWQPKRFANFSYRKGTARPDISPPSNEVIRELKKHYAPHDDCLAEMLGRKPSWLIA